MAAERGLPARWGRPSGAGARVLPGKADAGGMGGTEARGTKGSPGPPGQDPSRWVYVCLPQPPSLSDRSGRPLSPPQSETVLRAARPCLLRTPPFTGQTLRPALVWEDPAPGSSSHGPSTPQPEKPELRPPAQGRALTPQLRQALGVQTNLPGLWNGPFPCKTESWDSGGPFCTVITVSPSPSPCDLFPSHQGTPSRGPVSRGSTLWWGGEDATDGRAPGSGKDRARLGGPSRVPRPPFPSQILKPSPAHTPGVPCRLCVPSPDSPGGLALCPHPPPPGEASPGRKSLTDQPHSRTQCALFSL